MFFFFKQKTAYEMRISDWSSDVCSSDLGERRLSHRAFQAALFINLYRDEPALQEPFRLLTLLMDIEQGFTTWRYRHALMTQRMIEIGRASCRERVCQYV